MIVIFRNLIHNTVQLDFNGHQDKRKLGFKRQIASDQLHIYVLNHLQHKKKLDFKKQISAKQNFS